MLVGDVVGLSFAVVEAGEQYWLESRPSEAGRNVLVRRGRDGVRTDVFSAQY
jgi:hypothetical protein